MRKTLLTTAFCLAMVRCGTASAASDSPSDAALSLIAAAETGDVSAMKRFYTPAAWQFVGGALPSERKLDNTTEIKREAAALGDVKATDQTITGDKAVVTLSLHHARYDERVRMSLARTKAGWQVSDDRPPFFVDEWPTAFTTWMHAYERASHAKTSEEAYGLILAGIYYATAAVEDRPDDIGLNYLVGHIYLDRLAIAHEPEFVIWTRNDTRSRAPTTRPVHHPVLLAGGAMLPELTHPTAIGPAPLQYLLPYDPPAGKGFRNGISPAALAYNYLRRAQVLQDTTGQQYDQVSPTIIEAGPSIALKIWAEEERDWARILADEPNGDEAHWQTVTFKFRRAAVIAADAVTEVDRLIPLVPANRRPMEFRKRDELVALRATADADLAWINWQRAASDKRAALATEFVTKCSLAKDAEYRYAIADIVPPTSASFPKRDDGKPFKREDLMAADPTRLQACYPAYNAELRQTRKPDFLGADRAEVDDEIVRIDDHLHQVH